MEEERTPDAHYNDRLMTGNADDEELMRVIETSRREYAEQEARRTRLEKKQAELRRQLAVPISRLKLWADTTADDHERACLRRLLAVLYARTRLGEEANTPLDDELAAFADKHLRPSRLFRVAYDALTTDDCTSCTPPGGG